MNFSKYRLQRYLAEGQAVSGGAQASIDTSMNSSTGASDGGMRAKEQQTANKARQQRQSAQSVGTSQKSNMKYEQSQSLKERAMIKAFESQKSNWRQELQEKVVDGQERDQHPFVTVMPTGDENLIQAMKQMGKGVKDKKDAVKEELETEEELELEEEKKKCKEGYKRNSEGKCVKKKKKKSKSKKTTIIVGRGYRPVFGYGHNHHHHDDDHDDDNGGGDGGGEAGGMGEMFDKLGDMLLQEKEWTLRDAQKAGVTVATPHKPYDWKTKNEKNAVRGLKNVKPTSNKDRAKD